MTKEWRLTKEEYEAWKREFLKLPARCLDTEATCNVCMHPLGAKEIVFRTLLTMEGAKPEGLYTQGLKSPDGVYIIYSYVCSNSHLTEDLIDDMIFLTSGAFDFDKWEWTDELVEDTIREVMEAVTESVDTWTVKPKLRERLDWRAIIEHQREHLDLQWVKKRWFFFASIINSDKLKEQIAKKREEKMKRKERLAKRYGNQTYKH